MKSLKRKVFDLILHSRIYPHIFFFVSPFKHYEMEHMMKLARPERDDRVLDIGCGHGLQTNVIGRHCREIIGIDVSKNDIDRANSEQHLVRGRINSRFECTSIEDAGFDADSFDKIYSFCVLEHVDDDASLLREAFRVLKPGGTLIMSVDSLGNINDETFRERHATRYKVHRLYTEETLRARLQDAGFTDLHVEPMFVSDFSRDLFIRGLDRSFIYRYTEAVTLYRRLSRHEERTPSAGRGGIMLAARAHKPCEVQG